MKRLFTIIFLCLAIFTVQAQQLSDQMFSKPKSHPRLILSQDDVASLRQAVEDSPQMARLDRYIIRSANKMLEQPVVEYKKQGKRLLTICRQVLERVLYCSYSYLTTKDIKYALRAEQEMLAACTFSDWNPSHFLDVGEMAFGLAIGYDWLYDVLSEESRATIRQGLIDKALNVALTPQAKFYRSKTNWNQVCNGGLVCAALAIAEDEPELAKTIVDKALATIGLALTNYAPDGAYPEGFQYWTYGTSYQVLLNDALETVFGHSNGLSDADGLLRSARFVQFMTAPSGDCFNFSDANPQAYSNIMMPWFAYKTNDPSLMWLEMSYLKDADTDFGEYNEERHLPCLLIFASRVDLSNIKPPKEYVWSSDGINPLFIYRSGWQSANDIYLGIKGGLASFSHAHMDAGSFIFESQGVRWACDLGNQKYAPLENAMKKLKKNLWDRRQQSGRWTVFRYNNYSHNTITLNENLHNAEGVATFEEVIQTDTEMGVVIDMTDVLKGDAVSAQRTVKLVDKKDLVVSDRVVAPEDKIVTYTWRMTGSGEPEVRNDGIVLTANGKTMYLKAEGNVKFEYSTWSTEPKMDYDDPNEGKYAVGIIAEIPSGKIADFKVVLSPDEK